MDRQRKTRLAQVAVKETDHKSLRNDYRRMNMKIRLMFQIKTLIKSTVCLITTPMMFPTIRAPNLTYRDKHQRSLE